MVRGAVLCELVSRAFFPCSWESSGKTRSFGVIGREPHIACPAFLRVTYAFPITLVCGKTIFVSGKLRWEHNHL